MKTLHTQYTFFCCSRYTKTAHLGIFAYLPYRLDGFYDIMMFSLLGCIGFDCIDLHHKYTMSLTQIRKIFPGLSNYTVIQTYVMKYSYV